MSNHEEISAEDFKKFICNRAACIICKAMVAY